MQLQRYMGNDESEDCFTDKENLKAMMQNWKTMAGIQGSTLGLVRAYPAMLCKIPNQKSAILYLS